MFWPFVTGISSSVAAVSNMEENLNRYYLILVVNFNFTPNDRKHILPDKSQSQQVQDNCDVILKFSLMQDTLSFFLLERRPS